MGFADRLRAGMSGSEPEASEASGLESKEAPKAPAKAPSSPEVMVAQIWTKYRAAMAKAGGNHVDRRRACEWFLAHAIVNVDHEPDPIRKAARLELYDRLTKEQDRLCRAAEAEGEPWNDEPTVRVEADGTLRRC